MVKLGRRFIMSTYLKQSENRLPWLIPDRQEDIYSFVYCKTYKSLCVICLFSAFFGYCRRSFGMICHSTISRAINSFFFPVAFQMIYNCTGIEKEKRQTLADFGKKGVNVVHQIVNNQIHNSPVFARLFALIRKYVPKMYDNKLAGVPTIVFIVASGCTTFILLEPFHLTTHSILMDTFHSLGLHHR